MRSIDRRRLVLSPLVPGEIGVGGRGGMGVAKFRWQLIGGVPFTASLPAAATGGTWLGLVALCSLVVGG